MSGSADGLFVAFSDAQRCRLLELTGAPQGTVTSVKRHSLPAELPAAHMLCFTASPSTWTARIRRPKLLLVAVDGSLTMYDISSGQTQHVFPALRVAPPPGRRKRLEPPASRRASEQLAFPVSAITVSADGRRAAIAAASQVHPLAVVRSELTQPIITHVQELICAAGEAQIRLYDLVHYRLEKGRFPPAADGTTVTALAFSGAGSTLAAATAGGHLLLYQVNSCHICRLDGSVNRIASSSSPCRRRAVAAQMASHKLSDWYVRHKDVLMRRVNAMPGIVREISFTPSPEVIAHLCRFPLLPAPSLSLSKIGDPDLTPSPEVIAHLCRFPLLPAPSLSLSKIGDPDAASKSCSRGC